MSLLEIQLTTHAIERFQQRVRPGLDLEAAGDELARLLATAAIVQDPPDWFARRQARVACSYLVVGDLVLPLQQSRSGDGTLVAVSCIPRGSLSEMARARRNSARRRANLRARPRAFPARSMV